MKCSMPAALASSTTCWISGRSTTVSISLGTALLAGRKRVPRPATGNTALRTGAAIQVLWQSYGRQIGGRRPLSDSKRRIATAAPHQVNSADEGNFCLCSAKSPAHNPPPGCAESRAIRRVSMARAALGLATVLTLVLVVLTLAPFSAPAADDAEAAVYKRAVEQRFAQWMEALWPDAQAAGVSRATFDANLKGL